MIINFNDEKWQVDGVDYTIVPYPDFPENKGGCPELTLQWLEEHTEGNWDITPAFVAFELDSDALIFKLGF